MPDRAPLHSRRVRALVAIGAVAVLASGYLLRPQAQRPPPPLEEAPSPILREAVARRENANLYAALQETAADAVRFSARVTVPPSPVVRWSDWKDMEEPRRTRFAVPLDGNRLLADAADLREGASVQVTLGDGRAATGFVMARFPATGLALIAVGLSPPIVAATRAAASPRAGDLVVGVAPGEEEAVVVPLVVAERVRGTLVLAGEVGRLLGMPVFAAGGGLLGVVAASDAGMAVVPVADVLRAPPPAPRRMPLGVSLRVVPTEGQGTSRIEVEDVAPGGVAARAGLDAGDTLLAVAGNPVSTLDQAVAALDQRAGELTIRVRRGARTRVVRLPAEDREP